MGLLIMFIIVAISVLEYRIRVIHKEHRRRFDAIQTQIQMLLLANKIAPSDIELPESLRTDVRKYIIKNKDYNAQILIKETLCVDDNIASIILLKIKDPLFAETLLNEKTKIK